MMKKRARLGQRKRTKGDLRMLFTARTAGGLVVEVLKVHERPWTRGRTSLLIMLGRWVD